MNVWWGEDEASRKLWEGCLNQTCLRKLFVLNLLINQVIIYQDAFGLQRWTRGRLSQKELIAMTLQIEIAESSQLCLMRRICKRQRVFLFTPGWPRKIPKRRWLGVGPWYIEKRDKVLPRRGPMGANSQRLECTGRWGGPWVTCGARN